MKIKTSPRLLSLLGYSLVVVATFFLIQHRLYAVSDDVVITSIVPNTVTLSTGTSANINRNSVFPVFKIQFPDVEATEALQTLDVIINSNATGDVGAITSDVLEDNRVYDGGWQLWKDSSNGTAGTFEQFTDEQLLLDSSTLNYAATGSFTIDLATAETLTDNDVFYIALRSDNTGLPSSAVFTVSLSDITTSGSTQPSFTTVESPTLAFAYDDWQTELTAKCVRLEMLDGSLDEGDRIKFIFSQGMDFSYLSDGLGWYIYSYDSSWNQRSFGGSPTFAYSNDGGSTNDTLTITLGSNPNITLTSRIYYSFPSANGQWSWGNLYFDNTNPSLDKAELITDVNSDGEANDIGDQIAFLFSESIDYLSEDGDSNTPALTPNNINTLLQLSFSATYDESGAKPILTWWGPSILIVTLQENLNTDLVGKTVIASTNMKDISGNSFDSTPATVTIQASPISPVSSVVLSDIDTANGWLNKHDIGIDYVLPSYSSAITSDADFHVDLYLLPENVGFDFSSNYRVHDTDLTSSQANTTYSFDGATVDYSLYYDSRTNYVAIENNDYDDVVYYSFDQNARYVAYAVVSTGAHASETAANRSIPQISEPIIFTTESWSEETSSPWVEESTPNSSSAAINTKVFSMTFSEALNTNTASDADNYSLKYDDDGDWTYETEITISDVSYDSDTFTVYVSTTSNLQANTYHMLEVDGAVDDLYGTSVGDWCGIWFRTGSTADSTGPTISSTNVSDGQTSVSPSLSSITVVFNEPMSALTLTTTSATLDPTVADVSPLYDVSANALKYSFGSQNMVEDTAYTLTLDGSIITDSQGNFLDGDANSIAGDSYTLDFTTGTLDTTQPKILWSTFDGYNMYIGFDKEMKEADVEDYTNWTFTCDDGDDEDENLSWASFTWDEYNYELSITGLYCEQDVDYTITASNSVRGGNNQVIDSDYNSSTGTVETATTDGGSRVGGSTYDSTYTPVYVWPSDKSANESTYYNFSLPTNKALGDGYKIIIEWPSGFDISNVSVSSLCDGNSYGNCSWNNNDVNGTWNGIYDEAGGTFYDEGRIKIYDLASGVTCPGDSECISNDTVQNKTTLFLWMDYDDDGTRDSTAVTKASDYIYLDLAGVGNPSTASEVNWSTDTGGYQINISTRTDIGARLEGPLTSQAFSIVESGTGTLSGKVTANTTDGVGIADATVYASGPAYKMATTDANGDWSISNAQNGSWWFWVRPPNTGRYTYDYSSNSSSCTTSDSSQNCTFNGTLKSLDYSISGSIVHSTSLGGKSVRVWQYGQEEYTWSEVTVTLENDGVTPYTVYAALGKTEVGIYETYYSNDFASPEPASIDVTGNTTGVNFILTVADKDLPITVLDADSTGLENVSVGAYSYDDGYGFGAWGTTGSDGTVTLQVIPGDYTAYAYQSGFGNAEKAISVASDGTLTPSGGLVFKFKEADSTISGRVLDDASDPIQWVSISYVDSDGITKWDSTDSNGDYTLWVPGGANVTGTVKAYSWQHGGNLPAATGVDITDFAIASDSTITSIDFQYDPDAYATISGQVTADDEGIKWTSIWAEEVNATTGIRTGYYGSWTSTDSAGNYTLELTKNSDTTCYDVYGWTSNYGELPEKSCLDVSDGNLTGEDWTLGDLQTLTISVDNGPEDVNTGYLDIVQSGTETGIWETLTIANGAATESVDIWDGTYKATLYLDGFGEFVPESPDNEGFTIAGSNKTITFDLSSIGDVFTLSGQVTEDGVSGSWLSSSTVVDNARVSLFSTTSGKTISTKTDSSGNYTLTAEEDTYIMYVSKSQYVNSDQSTISSSGTYDFTITPASSTITGIGYRNSVAIENAWIIAKAEGSDKWSSTRTDGAGTFSLNVPDDDTLWDIEGMTKNGYRGTLGGVAAGSSSLTLNMDTEMETVLADQECTSAVASQTVTLDDEEDTGMSINVPANAYSDSSGENTRAGTLCVEDIAVPSSTTDAVDVVTAKEILLNDSEGVSQTQFQTDLDLTLTLTKTDIGTMLSEGTLPSCDDLLTLPIAYWEESSQTWVTMPTTRSISVKLTSDSAFAEAVYSTAINNICDTDTGTYNADFYNDYKITLRTSADHLTIFGIVVPSDTTPPSAPAGLAATTGDAQIVLDWDDNSESDLLEYSVYRSTSSTVLTIVANQINTSQVATSAYTDSTVTNDTKYYYVVTATDRSGNESTVSNTTSATPTAVSDETPPAAPTSLAAVAGDGSVALNWADNSEGDLAKYNVYRSTSASVSAVAGNRVNTTNVTSSAYSDTTATNDTKYYYVVTAVDTSNNESPASNEVYATPEAADTPPAAPSGLTASAAGDSYVTLDWADNSEEDFAKYNVYRSTSPSVTVTVANKINSSNVTSSTYNDTIVTNGTTYYYVVTALDTNSNESSASSEVQGTPQADTSGTTPSSSGGGSSDDLSSDEEIVADDESPPPSDEEEIPEEPSAPPATPFPDVTGHWGESFIAKLYDRGAVDGYPDGTYGPNKNINRAELSKIVLKLWGISAPSVAENPFPDVPATEWFAGAVTMLKSLAVIQGYPDGTFRPGQDINRAEALKILLKMSGLEIELIEFDVANPFTDVYSGEWYAPYVLYAYGEGYVQGYKDEDGNLTGEFGPGNPVTRSEIAKMASLIMGL